MPLRVLAWEAWAGPSLSDREAWREWAVADREWEAVRTASAPVASMPPILRRRADSADRLGLEVAFRLVPAGTDMPSVFASRHGQVTRSTSMLQAQAAGETASPTDFSLSVHNAAAGQFSIARGDRSASSSLSSRGESFAAALLEAHGLVMEGHERVLAVISDPALPAVLSGRSDGEPAGYGLGLVLGAFGGEAFEMSLGEKEAGKDSAWPQALVFLRMLAGGREAKRADWQRGTRRWEWTRG